jgi:hypothetical protein
VRVDDAESGSFADRSHPAVSGTSIEALAIAAAKDRSFTSFTYRKIDGTGGAWHEWDHRWLAAFADDAKRAMASFEAKIFDVGRTRLRDPQPVQAKQHGQRGVIAVVVLGGEQEPAELTAVHAVAFGRLDLRSSYVLGGVGRNATVDVANRK